jgi:S1-C subfamily serine protease
MNPTLPSLLALGGLLTLAAPARIAAQDLAAATREIFRAKQDAVVWVTAVAKLSFTAEGAKDAAVSIPDREQKMDGLGTIIDPAGMVVTALSPLDPSRDISGREVRGPSGPIKIEASAVLKDVKITLPDGTDIPAEVVMRDADLDLAFIRPKPGSKELKGVVFQALDLKDRAAASVADDAITLSRMDEVLNRAPTVTRGQITMVTKKPREFLRATGASLGCPTFAVSGKLIGITVNRFVRGKSSHNVIIPAADVLEIAEQAHAVKPAEAEKRSGAD